MIPAHPLPEHPNGMVFELLSGDGQCLLSETYFSIGGGFINTLAEIDQLQAPLKFASEDASTYSFDSAKALMELAEKHELTIAQMKWVNELDHWDETSVRDGLDDIWRAMKACIETGLAAEGTLPGGLNIHRRARNLYEGIRNKPEAATLNDWLCAYAMAVNEDNAAGHMVVTAPTNGAAGVIPAVLYYFVTHEGGTQEQVRDFLLTASAIGGLIKMRSSISGAEVGCQGEEGSAAAMAAAGLCEVRGGTARQVENAAEIALEHHLGMTCDPVKGWCRCRASSAMALAPLRLTRLHRWHCGAMVSTSCRWITVLKLCGKLGWKCLTNIRKPLWEVLRLALQSAEIARDEPNCRLGKKYKEIYEVPCSFKSSFSVAGLCGVWFLSVGSSCTQRERRHHYRPQDRG